MSQSIQVYTDGSCIGNPGPGGWAFLMKGLGDDLEKSDGEIESTNNRMEMTAVLRAFEHLNEQGVTGQLISVYTDSSLIVNTFVQNWKKKKNQDLWAEIEAQYLALYSKGNTVDWNWVTGHAGHTENERVDDLARGEAEALKPM